MVRFYSNNISILFNHVKAEVTFVNDDGISKVTLRRGKTNDSWGFRLSGGRDEGIALKLAKVKLNEKCDENNKCIRFSPAVLLQK